MKGVSMKLQKANKIMMLLLAVALISGNMSREIYAVEGKYELVGGVGDYGAKKRYYYIDDSCKTAGLAKMIRTCWKEWVNTKVYTPISVYETTTQSKSCFDFYYKKFYESYTTLDGLTLYFYNNEEAVSMDALGPGDDYDWAKININKETYASLNKKYTKNFNVKKFVVAHEIGHALGLIHEPENSSKKTIMQRETKNANCQKCQPCDLEDINKMYKEE